MKKLIWIIVAVVVLVGIGIFVLLLPITRPDLLYRSTLENEDEEKEEETGNYVIQKGSIKLLRSPDYKIVFSFPKEWKEQPETEKISSAFFKKGKNISKISSIAGVYDPATGEEADNKFESFSQRTIIFLLETEFGKDFDLEEFIKPHLEIYQLAGWQVHVEEFPCPNCEYSQYVTACLLKKSEEGNYNNTIRFYFLTGKEENKIYAIESYGLKAKILEDGIGIIDEPYNQENEEYYDQVSHIFESFQIEED